MKNQPFHRRLGFAVGGIVHAFRVESGFRIHVAASCIVVFALAILHAAAIWWAVGLITMTAVIAAELFNTAVEHLADHLHPQQHGSIKIVKDCAAGAVLVVSIGALGVAAAFVFSLLN